MTVTTYNVVRVAATVPEPGVRCISCQHALEPKCINDVLMAYWCPDPECVRHGLWSNAWLPPAETTGDSPKGEERP